MKTNKPRCLNRYTCCPGLYPTFKEWKLFPIPLERVKKCLSLYPTFKEWKQKRLQGLFRPAFRLYPTFKEWKHSQWRFMERVDFVYILPLRNEN